MGVAGFVWMESLDKWSRQESGEGECFVWFSEENGSSFLMVPCGYNYQKIQLFYGNTTSG